MAFKFELRYPDGDDVGPGDVQAETPAVSFRPLTSQSCVQRTPTAPFVAVGEHDPPSRWRRVFV